MTTVFYPHNNHLEKIHLYKSYPILNVFETLFVLNNIEMHVMSLNNSGNPLGAPISLDDLLLMWISFINILHDKVGCYEIKCELFDHAIRVRYNKGIDFVEFFYSDPSFLDNFKSFVLEKLHV